MLILAIPPLLGLFVRMQGNSGYASGFVILAALALISLGLAYVLRRAHISAAR